jgi:hypothetical protein
MKRTLLLNTLRMLALGSALLGVYAGAARAQTAPFPTSDDQMGLEPYQSYHGGDIDNVSLTTGTLTVSYPFLSHPQRGKLKLSFSLNYNNQLQHITELMAEGLTYMFWFTAPDNGLTAQQRSNPYVALDQQVMLAGKGISVYHDSNLTSWYSIWSLETIDGAKHLLGNMGSVVETCNGGGLACYSGTGPWESVDGTGWRVNPELITANEQYLDQAVTSVVAPDEVIYGAGGTIEDPNGNEITQSSNVLTDSIGRQIPLPPTSSSTSNGSGCPANEPLPVYSAVKWSVPLPNGGQEYYLFCYAQVPVNIPPGQNVELDPGLVEESVQLQSLVLPNQQAWGFAYMEPDLMATVP